MIFGYRTVASPIFTGANLILSRDWLQPVDALGMACFKAFDEALGKLRSDNEATRIALTQIDSPLAAELNTATEAALRSLPERHRPSTDFYTLTVTTDLTLERKVLWFNAPAWAYLHIETAEGEMFRVSVPGKGWRKVPLEATDRFVHLSLFTPELSLRLDADSRTRFTRLSRLIEEAQSPDLAASLSISVHPNEDSP